MKKGHNYKFSEIADFSFNEYETIEYGHEVVGENFVVLKHMEKDIVISFVLSGGTGGGYVYECIYSDLK